MSDRFLSGLRDFIRWYNLCVPCQVNYRRSVPQVDRHSLTSALSIDPMKRYYQVYRLQGVPGYCQVYRVSQDIIRYTGCPRILSGIQGVPRYYQVYRVSQDIIRYTGCPRILSGVQGVPRYYRVYRVSQDKGVPR